MCFVLRKNYSDDLQLLQWSVFLLTFSTCDFMFILTKQVLYEPHLEKTCFCHMRASNVQISLRIRTV